MDQYIEELGYAEVLANRLYWDQFVGGSLTDSAKIMTMNTLENVSYSSDTSEGYKSMTRFASSLEYSKSIELFHLLHYHMVVHFGMPKMPISNDREENVHVQSICLLQGWYGIQHAAED